MASIKEFNGVGGKKVAVRFDNWVLDLTFLPIFIAIFLIPSISLEENSFSSFSIFGSWVLEKALAWGSTLLVWWWTAKIIAKKGSRTISLFWIWLIGFLGGVLGCSVGEISAGLLGLSFKLDLPVRIIHTSISCICVIMMSSVLGQGRRSYIFVRNQVRRSLIRQRIAEIRLDKDYSERFSKLQEDISDKLDAVIDKNASKDNFGNIRFDLRHFSHDIFEEKWDHKKVGRRESKYFYSGFSYKLFLISLRSRPLNPNIFTLVITFFVALPLFRIENSLESAGAASFVTSTTLIIHNLQSYYWKSRPQVKLATLLAFDIVNILVLVGGLSYLKGNFGFYQSVTQSSILQLMLVTVYVFFFITGHVSRFGDLIKIYPEETQENEMINIPSDSELVRDEEFSIKQQWSKFIHSDLQSYLLVMDLSNKSVDRELILSELKIRALNFRYTQVFFGDQKSETLHECLSRLKGKWDEILDVIPNTDGISENVELSPQAILDLREVLSELAINAVKHGGADTLRVKLKTEINNSLVIRAENNGIPVGKTKPGLGSSVFDNLCGKNWSLRSQGGMVVFDARIYNH